MSRTPRAFALIGLAVALTVAAVAACGSSHDTVASRPSDAGDDARGTSDATDDLALEGGGEAAADGADDATPEDAPAESASFDAGNEDGGDAADAAPTVDANGPPFPCGPSLECFEVTQFCGQVTGPHGGTFYNCNTTPDACAGDLSCTCLAAQGIVSPCSEDDGGITVVATEP